MKLAGLFLRQIPITKSYTHVRCFSTGSHRYLQSLDNNFDSVHLIWSDPCFTILGLCKNLNSLKVIHSQLVVHGLAENLPLETKLVSMYGSFGEIRQARLIFDRIINPDFYSCKVMLRWYFLNDLYSEVMEFYSCMRQCLKEHDNVIFSVVLKACCELNDLEEGRKTHCQIVKNGNPDSFVLAGLLDMYAKCAMVEFSRQVFDEISEKDVVSWTSMISGYVQNDYAKEGLVLFNQMRWVAVEPNEFTIGSLLIACLKLGTLHQGKWVHGYIIKKGVYINSFLGTALLDMYVKCGTVTDGRSLFDELSEVDLVSWTAMIVGYTQRSHPKEALELFMSKRWAGVVPNSVTIASVLSACAQLGELNLGRSVHLLAIQLRLQDVTVGNALLDMYAKCGMIEDASYIFARISHKNVITWNSMIGGYSQNGFEHEALSLFHYMRSSPSLPDTVTLVNVLLACVNLGALQIGSSLHAYASKNGFLSNVYVGTTLLNLYAKCGDAGSARRVFDGMHEKNTVTWSAIVGGCGKLGDSSGSLSLFSKMLKEKLQPNDVIFTNILSACSHTGMVHEGLAYFHGMGQEHNVVPTMKHYVCMVDLLARAGSLEDALDFIDKMPIEADVSVWGALLHGCRLHSRLDLGEVAVKRMLELYPHSPGYYVLISNFYASEGKWDYVAKVRGLMKGRGLSKSPGCSFVEMDSMSSSSLKMVASLH